MDSIALAFWKRPAIAITVDYGQLPAIAEIQAASEVCKAIDIRHEVIRADCSSVGSGDLAGSSPLDIAPVSEWWPFRNQLIITIAAARGVALQVDRLLVGMVRGDSAHADGTQGFVERASALLHMQEGHLIVEAPAIDLSSSELILASGIPMELLAWAHSCHVSNLACGRCRGCAKHYATMGELGVAPY